MPISHTDTHSETDLQTGIEAPAESYAYDVDDYSAGVSLAESTNQVAGKPLSPEERAWKRQYLELLTGHPRIETRIGLAAHGSLQLARSMVHDRSKRVRQAIAFNPFIGDLDLQLALANDKELDVVLALIDATDPWLETCQVILTGPHLEARRELIERKNLRPEALPIAARRGL